MGWEPQSRAPADLVEGTGGGAVHEHTMVVPEVWLDQVLCPRDRFGRDRHTFKDALSLSMGGLLEPTPSKTQSSAQAVRSLVDHMPVSYTHLTLPTTILV